MINLDLFDHTISLLSIYKNNVLLNYSQKLAIGEAITRLKRAKEQYPLIMNQNSILLRDSSEHVEIRKIIDDEKLVKLLQDQSKNDQELARFLEKTGGKLVRENLTEVNAYDMNTLEEGTNPQSEMIKKLHLATEEFYENLWLIVQKLNRTPTFKNCLPKGVRDVRNHLIVHTHKSGAHIFSFGVSTSGPLLRPIKPNGIKAPNDNGFELNVSEFLNDIVNKFSKQL